MPSLADAKSNDPIEIALDDDVARDPSKDAVEIELPDGSITINFGPVEREEADASFDDNLAEILGNDDMAIIAEDLLQGIEEDEISRQEWLEERAEGIKLLALKVEKPATGAGGGAPVEGMSRVRHQLLLEGVLRFQANASGELLPADGPVKIRDDDQDDLGVEGDEIAEALGKDFNHYMTSTASEYYPDTDRMLFWVGFGGSGFKKVYRCPIRRRPVSESVDAVDLVVSNAATDLGNADRVTHVIKMRPSTLRRMQILGAYRDIDLGQPIQESKNAVEEAKERISGLTTTQTRPQDEPYNLYECYCQIDLPGFEHKEKGKATGLPLPYKVTIDKTSRQILEIRRNWREDDEMQLPRKVFVQFSYVRGLGFYGLGLLHIAGNPTVAATALWRIMIDAGMFANFPGFLYSKIAGRQNSNIFRIPPGGGEGIETGELPIGNVVMPLPYHEPGPAMFQLLESVIQSGERVAGTAELPVGEGRADAPVGTTLALIEQATKVMNAVHKRLHQAQSEEFQLLKDLFCENPEDFWRFNKKPATQWHKEKLIAALDNNYIVPVADPNTASHVQRLMVAQALYQMASASPNIWNVQEVQKFILITLGVSNPENLMAAPQQAPDPKAETAAVEAEAEKLDAQTRAGELQFKLKNADVQDKNRDLDRQSKEKIAVLNLERENVIHRDKLSADLMKHGQNIASDHAMQKRQHAHDVMTQALGAAIAPQEGDPAQ
jgi:hypothetical protein